MELIIGTYSTENEPGIYRYRWDTPKNEFVAIGNITGIENPSYLDVDSRSERIYAITEKKEGGFSELHVYDIGTEDQAAQLSCLTFLGAGSCYISSNSSKQHAFVANYQDGTLSVIELPLKTEPGRVVQTVDFSGNGPNKERQDQPHLHAALLSKDERYLYCSDLGSDRLYRFVYSPEGEKPLEAEEPQYLDLPPGSGPRHFIFSPEGRWLYLVTEMSGDVFLFDMQAFATGWQQQVSLLQEGYQGKIEAGDIQIHPNGQFLYASSRGEANEIIVFSIDQNDGKLNFLQRIGAAGLSPRSLLICEEENLVLAANEQSDNVSIFSLNEEGTLTFSKMHLEVPCPTCLKVFRRNSK
jgi:6-phosphogluconolactonase